MLGEAAAAAVKRDDILGGSRLLAIQVRCAGGRIGREEAVGELLRRNEMKMGQLGHGMPDRIVERALGDLATVQMRDWNPEGKRR